MPEKLCFQSYLEMKGYLLLYVPNHVTQHMKNLMCLPVDLPPELCLTFQLRDVLHIAD